MTHKISNLPSVRISNDDFTATLSEWKSPQTIVFYGDNNDVIGTIDFSGSELSFSGKADVTAKMFFDSLIACNSTYIKGLLSEIEILKQKQ